VSAFGKLFSGGKGDGWAKLASFAVIIIAAAFILNIFCERLPKRFASFSDGDKIALGQSAVISALDILLRPFTAVGEAAAEALASVFSSKGRTEDEGVTEEDILMMVDAGNETGVIEEDQKNMINNIFGWGGLTASDVMTHRTDIVGTETEAGISEVVNTAISSGFSRIPVYDGSMDHIAGVICVKDLLCMVGSEASADAKAKDFVREIMYVPESMPCGELFRQMSERKMQMAVVADEYGGTAGIVTMEDVLESIVGSIRDEYDDEEEEIKQISDETYTISGSASPEEVFRRLGEKLPDECDFDTMSGFIVDKLGRIPEENENPSVCTGNVIFTVLITEDMCISKLKAEIVHREINEENAEEPEDDTV
jgi:putative hemolysin